MPQVIGCEIARVRAQFANVAELAGQSVELTGHRVSHDWVFVTVHSFVKIGLRPGKGAISLSMVWVSRSMNNRLVRRQNS